MSELREWLRRHNLEQYADAFEANDIGIDILPELAASARISNSSAFPWAIAGGS